MVMETFFKCSLLASVASQSMGITSFRKKTLQGGSIAQKVDETKKKEEKK